MLKKFKKQFKYILLFMITIILLVVLTGCQNSISIEEKVEEELNYIDNRLLLIANSLDNLSFVHYKVEPKEIKGSTKKEESSAQKKESSSEKTNEGEESGDQEESKEIFSMTSNSILSNDRNQIDWSSLKLKVENLYETWSTVTIDLQQVIENKDSILAFNTYLDSLINAIQTQDKIEALKQVSNLYQLLPSYLEAFSPNQEKISLSKTKSFLITAYAIVEKEQWEQISQAMASAEENFLPFINNTQTNENKQSDRNKVYVLLKELIKTVNEKNKEIFYLKYKVVMQELNNIM